MTDAPKEVGVTECENLIKQIRDVISVSVVVGDNKEIDEIHVLAEDTRNAKQLVRDIETLLHVECGLDLDHKKISVVQLNREQQCFQGKRVKFTAIQYSLQGSQMEVQVEVTSDKQCCQGKSAGINSTSNRLRLFAEATLNALADFWEPTTTVILEDAVQYALGRCSVVVVALTYINGTTEECLVGSAQVKLDEKESVVRATLDALNRRIPVDI